MSSLSKRAPAWVSDMKSRYFWGMPHTETDITAFKAALVARAEAVAAGRFAAVAYVETALERVTRRSLGLLIACLLLTLVCMLLAYKGGTEQAASFLQLNRWGLALALVSALILSSNLALVWASDATRNYGDPDAAYEFQLGVYKSRAWRYTTALVLAVGAFGCTLVSLVPMK